MHLSPTRCPPPRAFADALAGRLDRQATDELAAHALECSSCAAVLRSLSVPPNDLAERPTPIPVARPQAARMFGPYRLISLLGAGGMGEVFLAEDTRLARRVALKVMGPKANLDPAASARFLAEARAAARVKHPRIITIYDVGEADGTAYLAMEYLEGESLSRRWHRDVQLPIADIVRIGREVCEGLAAAHAVGLIHRDIKPENVWLEAPHGSAKVLDFGLALSLLASDARLTSSGLIVGTPQFMSPEQARGHALDPRTDLFSIGVVLYGLATGKLPFDGPNPTAILTALAIDEPPDPRIARPDLPANLAVLILQLLAKHPSGRPGSSKEVAERLADLDRDDKTPTVPLRPTARATPARASRWPMWVGMLAGGCALGTVLVVLFVLFLADTRKPISSTVAITSPIDTPEPTTKPARREPVDLSFRPLVDWQNLPGQPMLVREGRRMTLPAKAWASHALPEEPPYTLRMGVQHEGGKAEHEDGVWFIPKWTDGSLGSRPDRAFVIWDKHIEAIGGQCFPFSAGETTRLTVRVDAIGDQPAFTSWADGKFVGHGFVWRMHLPLTQCQIRSNGRPLQCDNLELAVDQADSRELSREWGELLARLYREPGPAVADDFRRFARRCDETPGSAGRLLAEAARGIAPEGATLLKCKHQLVDGKDDWIRRVRWSPDGQSVAAVYGGGFCLLWDTQTGRVVRRFSAEPCNYYTDLGFTPDGKSLFVTGLGVHKVYCWSTNGKGGPIAYRVNGLPNALAVSTDGKSAYWGVEGPASSTVYRLDCQTDQVKEVERQDRKQVYDVCVSETGSRLVAYGDGLFTLDGETLWDKPGPHWQIAGALSRDGRWAATHRLGEEVRLWDAKARKLVRTVPAVGTVLGMEFSPDGERLALSAGNMARIVEVATGRELYRLYGHRANVVGVSWSPDGKRLATCDEDVRLWDVP